MREILFRGKDVVGNWHIGLLAHLGNGWYISNKACVATDQISFESGSFILVDRQGEMISKIGGENDHCYSLFDLSLECCWEDDWAVDIEVSGNIHDNPELLKGGK